MRVEDYDSLGKLRGVASTIGREELQLYSERVGQFIERHSALGDKWVKRAGGLLYTPLGLNKQGEVTGSNSYIGVAMASLCPEIPVATGRQLLGMYELAGKKNPFGSVYIEFGVQVNGKPNTNPVQAKALQEDYKRRNISPKENFVPDFKQLVLVPNQDAGFVFNLAEDVSQGGLTKKEDYPFYSFGNNGLFRAYLYRDGSWDGYNDSLAGSNDNGRVVRYDAEGVARVNLAVPQKKSLATLLQEDFNARNRL